MSNGDAMWRNEVEEGSYECYERKEESKNYFKNEDPQKMVE